MGSGFERMDAAIISFLRRTSAPFGRAALFVVFFWFGALKLLGTSSANPLVAELLERTLPFLTFEQFIRGFALYEMAIGISFLVPGLERLAIALLLPHMATTFLPLLLLPQVTWQEYLIPSLEGQYIIKNLVIVALALGIAARIEPHSKK